MFFRRMTVIKSLGILFSPKGRGEALVEQVDVDMRK